MKFTGLMAVAVTLCLNTSSLYAQQNSKNKQAEIKKEETVIIKKSSGSPQTVIEIKKGNVFVNGEKVASTEGNANKKIIIDSEADIADINASSPGYQDKGMRKVMLGVITNPEKSGSGAFIERIAPGSAAREAGLHEGDIIKEVDGKAINNPKELVEAIGRREAGDKVTITYERDGNTYNTEAKLSGMAPEWGAQTFRFHDFEDLGIPNPMAFPFDFDIRNRWGSPSPKLGITAEDKADETGVLILDVKQNSIAEKAGLHKGDVILKFANEEINSINKLQSILRRVQTNESLKLEYLRDGKKHSTDIIFPRQVNKQDL